VAEDGSGGVLVMWWHVAGVVAKYIWKYMEHIWKYIRLYIRLSENEV
jgi:hypothetical protein